MAQLSIDPKQSEIFNRLSQLGTEAGRVGKASSGSHLHKFSSYKCYIFKSSILNLNH